jgi:glutathione S-transferase
MKGRQWCRSSAQRVENYLLRYFNALIAYGENLTILQITKVENTLSQIETEYICGDEITLADISLFACLGEMLSTHVKGVPADLYDQRPQIQAFRRCISNHPKVMSRYVGTTEVFHLPYLPF